MLIYLIFVSLLVLAVVVLTSLRRKGRIARKGLLLLGLILLIGGGIFGVTATDRLVTASATTHWPAVSGTVTSAEVIGDRAYRPLVKYDYNVDGSPYSGESDLEIPGFGNQSKRLDVAQKLVAEYPVGTSVPVYYNPDNPAESRLVHHVPWNTYAQLGLAIFIALAGAVILVFFVYRPEQSDAAKAIAAEIEKTGAAQ